MAGHILGAPLSKAKRDAHLDGLQGYFGSKRGVVEFFVKTIDRITNKSLGVMTADSVFSAMALFLSDRKPWGILSLLALIALVLAVGLCCSILIATSSGIATARLNEDAIMAHGLKVSMARTIRFTLALYLSGLGFLLILIQVLLETFRRMGA